LNPVRRCNTFTFPETTIMTNVLLRAAYPAQARRGFTSAGFTRAMVAIAGAVATVFEVLVEAESQSSAARNRFPHAD
jgi:hypothetical protein